MGQLQAFYCSLYDAPGYWGARFGDFVGKAFFEGRRADGLVLDQVVEFPWPLVWKAIRDRLYRRGKGNWLTVNSAFDLWAAGRLQRELPSIFVGTASSDLYSLKAAKRIGATLVHDCPGVHPYFEARILEEAAERAGMQTHKRAGFGLMKSRKLREYALADVLMVYSDFHRKSFQEQGYPSARIFQSALWADSSIWYRDALDYPGCTIPKKPLKLLFVGSISLRKGIPFLLDAIAQCGAAVELTLVGSLQFGTHPSWVEKTNNVTYLGPQSKTQLRNTYQSHDVLVLPSVCDSFGFVALEAMACGLPVVMTENCGAPSPDPSWKVRAMDSQQLAERIVYYSDDRARLREDGAAAMAFAALFTPQRYRCHVRELFSTILNMHEGKNQDSILGISKKV